MIAGPKNIELRVYYVTHEHNNYKESANICGASVSDACNHLYCTMPQIIGFENTFLYSSWPVEDSQIPGGEGGGGADICRHKSV